jgi:hypothetical protein
MAEAGDALKGKHRHDRRATPPAGSSAWFGVE